MGKLRSNLMRLQKKSDAAQDELMSIKKSGNMMQQATIIRSLEQEKKTKLERICDLERKEKQLQNENQITADKLKLSGEENEKQRKEIKNKPKNNEDPKEA